MSSRRQNFLTRVKRYFQSSLKHIIEQITCNNFYYRGGRYRQVSLYTDGILSNKYVMHKVFESYLSIFFQFVLIKVSLLNNAITWKQLVCGQIPYCWLSFPSQSESKISIAKFLRLRSARSLTDAELSGYVKQGPFIVATMCFHGNNNKKTILFILNNIFEYIVCKMAAILLRPNFPVKG